MIKHYLVSIHGVRSDGQWQVNIDPAFEGIADFAHRRHSYGWLRADKTIRQSVRDEQVQMFATFCDPFLRSGAKVSVIAHSFGSWIACTALEKYDSLTFHRFILCGSVVDCDFDWPKLFEQGKVDRVLNELCNDDSVVKMMRSFTPFPGSGPSGVDGFTKKHERLENRQHPDHDHSELFLLLSHCERYWRPFILGHEEFADLCNRYCRGEEQAMQEFDRMYLPVARAAIRFHFGERTEASQDVLAFSLLPLIAEEGRSGTVAVDIIAVSIAGRLTEPFRRTKLAGRA